MNREIESKHYNSNDYAIINMYPSIFTKYQKTSYYLLDSNKKYIDYSIYNGVVLYNNKKQQKILREILLEYNKYINIWICNKNDYNFDRLRWFRIIILSYIFLLKSPKYEYEKEYRLIIIPNDGFNSFKKKTNNGKNKKYIELKLENYSFIDSLTICSSKRQNELINECNNKNIKLK